MLASMRISTSWSRRWRVASGQEAAAIPWLAALSPEERMYVLSVLRVADVAAGDIVVEMPTGEHHWLGLIDGLLQLAPLSGDGRHVPLVGVAPGGWFSEPQWGHMPSGRYRLQAVRPSVVAELPASTLQALAAQSLGLNHYLRQILQAQLAQCRVARELDRSCSPDVRVARSLAHLFDPVLHPGVGAWLRITQQELATVVDLSRQRVNGALSLLEAHGAIAVEYGGLRLLHLTMLQQTEFALTPSRARVHLAMTARA
jgi:CRP/FNR family cyclic AMP-dependent transcriptional regulator